MTLGRVYVPPNRTTSNVFITSRILEQQSYKNNHSLNNNNVIEKNVCDSKKFNNGSWQSIEIQCQKKEDPTSIIFLFKI